MSTESGSDVVKWFTRARKFPQLIGRTPDGTRIWGGPYTLTQALGGAGVLVVGLKTMSLWAHFGFIGSLVVLVAVTGSVVWGLGRIPVGARSPLSMAAGLAHAVGAPKTGRLGGRPIRIRRPHQLRHTVIFAVQVPDENRAANPSGNTSGKPAGKVGKHAGRGVEQRTRTAEPTPQVVEVPLSSIQSLLAAPANVAGSMGQGTALHTLEESR
ncbi:hypothetical protein ACFVBP_10505 [Nocardioides sp. NPDC057764]|uniref:hypothetical protein n=1 Tax=Nocardioides sp. NPDC057764 TaxID=3346243 RepID=UPI00366FD6AF